MKLVKLVYIAHGWSLGLESKPLIEEDIQAWQYGPVIESVYREFRKYGRDPITEPAEYYDWLSDRDIPYDMRSELSESDSADSIALVEQVWKKYGDMSAFALSTLTHSSESPWSEATENGQNVGKGKVLTPEVIKMHYQKLAGRLQGADNAEQV